VAEGHGERVHGYTVKPRPRRPAEFAGAVADSFRPEASFVNHLRIVRHTPEVSHSLKDFTVEISRGADVEVLELPGRQSLLAFVEDELGLRRAVVAEACDALAARGHAAFA